MERFDAEVLCYCRMGNHYHFVLHTRQAKLSRLMRHVNGVYTQDFNRRHGKVGHLFQGRFKAILVDRDAYLLTLCRYVELNRVRARMVAAVGDWPWSSYRAHVGLAPAPPWLDSAGLHAYVLGREVRSESEQRRAATKYAALVANAPVKSPWEEALRQQIYLGDDAFVERMQAHAEPARVHWRGGHWGQVLPSAPFRARPRAKRDRRRRPTLTFGDKAVRRPPLSAVRAPIRLQGNPMRPRRTLAARQDAVL